ncbi:hypothetical protein AB4142_05875 [Variovorax sp. 2RAF20]|uniref:hypothetical protein n=1 Tax=Variovorax sp. CF313 TaxID=1144315 RepID=UPI000271025C|nr:hypothetical protein [Variovorax sp. CF313]EJL76623.1 hypothetical protein PMI12_02386 [Variovorax sp. CF313]
MNVKPLNAEAAARLRRELAAIDLQLEVELAAIRLASIESRLEQFDAMQRQRRRAAQSAGQTAAAEHDRAMRQARLAQGLGIALFGGAAALFAAAPRQHSMGLRDLD